MFYNIIIYIIGLVDFIISCPINQKFILTTEVKTENTNVRHKKIPKNLNYKYLPILLCEL